MAQAASGASTGGLSSGALPAGLLIQRQSAWALTKSINGLQLVISMSIIDIDIMPKQTTFKALLELLVMKILRRGPNHGSRFRPISSRRRTRFFASRQVALPGSASDDGGRTAQGGVAACRKQDAGRGSTSSRQRGAASSKPIRRDGARFPQQWRRFSAHVHERRSVMGLWSRLEENISRRPSQRRHRGGAAVPSRHGRRRTGTIAAKPGCVSAT